MARKRYGLTEARIMRFYREGRGFGTGKNYKPFWTVADVPSEGRSHRVYCPKTERDSHLLSDIEYYAFLREWWDDNVIDIQEQFPFYDRSESLEIAARCGIKHPIDRHSGTLWIITTDLVITRRTPQGVKQIAYAVKDSKELANERTLELLEIERRLWERREIPWFILTDREVKNTFTLNLAWILNPKNLSQNNLHGKMINFDLIKRELILAQSAYPLTPIRLLCRIVDEKLAFKTAVSLGVFRQLLGAKIITIDLNLAHIQDLPAQSFMVKEV